jgi:hypothetical protein
MHTFNPLNTDILLIYRPNINTYLTENTFLVHSKDKPFKAWYSWIRASQYESVEITNKMQLVIEFIIPKFIKGLTCFKRHTAHHQELWTVFVASGLYTHVVTGRCPGWTTAGHHMGTKTRGCEYSLELLMMSGMPLKTCWAFNKFWNNKFYYNIRSCWLFLLTQISSSQHLALPPICVEIFHSQYYLVTTVIQTQSLSSQICVCVCVCVCACVYIYMYVYILRNIEALVGQKK